MEEELFLFSETDREVQQHARHAAQTHVKPFVADTWDPNTAEEALLKAFELLRSTGSPALNIPEEYDGFGGTTKQGAIATEEFCAVDGALPLLQGVTFSLFALPILLFGNEEQKQFFLPRVARGEIRGCYMQTTPNAGSDVAAIDTIAAQRDGRWYITGSKRFITAGSVANWALVLSHTDPAKRGLPYSDPERYSDLAMFVVDLERAKGAGQVTQGRNELKAGMHASPTTEFALDDCVADDILGEVGDGWRIAMLTLASSRASVIAGQSLGILRGAYDTTKLKIEDRTVFGKKVLELPVIKETFTEIEAKIQMARLLTWRACILRDQLPEDQRSWEAEASMAKLFASMVAVAGTYDLIQCAGGAGYIMETGIAKYWLDSGLPPIYEGTSNIQKLVINRRVVFLRLLKKLSTHPELQERWRRTTRWLFTGAEEEWLFRKRTRAVRSDPFFQMFLQLRKKLVAVIQEALEKFPPHPQEPTLPAPWFRIAWALTVLEGVKLLVWKKQYLAETQGEEEIPNAVLRAGLEEAERAVYDAWLPFHPELSQL